MELRTTFTIEPSQDKITHNDQVMFIGSCFASSIGSQMEMGNIPVMINPAGAVFNPVSVSNTLDTIRNRGNFFWKIFIFMMVHGLASITTPIFHLGTLP